MSRSGSGLMRTLGVVAAWAIGGGILLVLAAALSFFLTVRIERRSTQVVVPDLAGMSQEDAIRAATPGRLVVEVADLRHDPRIPSGRVIQQDPPAGASVRRGRKVRIVLSLGGQVLEVPDLVGQPERKVEIELRQDGLAAGDAATVPSRAAAAGTVIAQVPPPDSPAVPGTRVYRLVSAGPEPPRWVMPDLIGRPLQRAEEWIERGGFRKGAVRRLDSTGRSPGTVVGQLPPAGYPVRGQDVVELTVAR